MTKMKKATVKPTTKKARKPATAKQPPVLWFKVLVNGKSCHGGEMTWSLPTKQKNGQWKPGEWHDAGGKPVMCGHPGIHLTKEPAKWAGDKSQFYIAEYDGEIVDDGTDKISCRKVRLLREASIEELESVNVFFTGTHSISDGTAAVYGGTIKSVSGGTIKFVYGGTIESVSGGTIKSVSGGTIKFVYGSSVINDCRKLPEKFDGYCVLIDRSQTPPKIICGWDKKGGGK